MSSQPKRLEHGDTLMIGSTKLTAHIHASWGCDACRVTGTNVVSTEPQQHPREPAKPKLDKVVSIGPAKSKSKASLEAIRKQELRRLRREALGEDGDARDEDEDQNHHHHHPRRTHHEQQGPQHAQRPRRNNPRHQQTHSTPYPPPTPHHPSSLDTPLTHAEPTNVGSRMLQKMGWTAGQGLGATGHGRVEPVAVATRQGRLGLGMEDGPGSTAGGGGGAGTGGRRETLKEATVRRARERFSAMMED
ncbi:hypothetical protein PhCBS80983_g06375 [Powellomyces hirtus]|uniref:G-patch domain-containing protein n=1 Tax=Powellomyces hirtus TaxID=109895 RepID=A0A507DPB2_9FUNG|nr:hypothetical protein PhCBS80983_g06375 [Powellomyces hirtus]